MNHPDDKPNPAGEPPSDPGQTLRRQAEEILRTRQESAPEAIGIEQSIRLVHELRVHQIELEMQNEELRRAHAELEDSQARFVDLYDFAPVGYVTVSEAGMILQANLTAATFLGAIRGALIRQPLTRFILPEDQDMYYRHRKRLFETGEPQACELRMLRPDSPPFWARMETTVAQDADGGPVCRIAMSDITERKRAEETREKLQAQLAQAQKMESVGRLAGGVAHDFNNMLGIILGHTEMALEQMDPAQPLFARLLKIREAAERSANLTRQLLAFARKQIAAPRVLNLNETVEGMLKMLRRLIGEDIQLAWLPGANLWPVKVDPGQIDQILVNLCINARDAIAGVGKVIIETENAALDKTYCTKHTGSVPGEYVLLTLIDNGCGMNEKTLANTFEPFFTTKAVGQGVGLGLATAYGIVKQNNGFINLCSAPGQGTTVEIYLPRHIGKTEQMRQKGLAAPAGKARDVLK